MENDKELEDGLTLDVFPDGITEIIYLPADSDVSYYLDNERLTENGAYEIDSSNLLETDLSELLLLRNNTYVISTDDNRETKMNDEMLQSSDALNYENDDMELHEQFFCKKCDHKTNSFELLEAHQLIHKLFSCNLCSSEFIDQSQLDHHIKNEHAAEKFKDAKLQSFDSVIIEDEDDDMALDEQFYCMQCNYKTNSFELLETHLLVHKLLFPCKLCRSTFIEQSQLNHHIKDEHTTFKCKVCAMECYGRKSYNSHTRIHKSKKTFVCQKCNVVFTNTSDLMRHMGTHGELLLYACNKCDEAFSSTYEVSAHLRKVHTIGTSEVQYIIP